MSALSLRALFAFVGIVVVSAPTVASAQGWYLMVSPFTPVPPKLLDSTPLAQWNHDGAFDTAAECEAAKRARADFTLDRLNRAGGPETEQYALSAVLYLRAESAVCISAADPRLVPKGTR
jgi:hypothetical protein